MIGEDDEGGGREKMIMVDDRKWVMGVNDSGG